MRHSRRLLALPLALLVAAPAAAQTRLATVVGKKDDDDFSQSADFLGDIDGDGCDDMIVGSPGSDSGGENAGRVVILSGGTGKTLKKRTGGDEWDAFGHAVAGLGDVDGDGVGDYAIGAYGKDSGGLSDNGVIEVYSGATHDKLYSIKGTVESQRLGRAIAGVGDVDGDGRGDFLAGEENIDTGAGADAGRVTLYSGADGSVIQQVDGAVQNGRMGETVSAAGDADDDGELDYFYGSKQGDGTSKGRVWVRSGDDGLVLHEVTGGLNGTKLGTSIAALGDVDKDGHDDVIAGGYQDDTAANNAGIAYVISGDTGGNLYAPTGGASYDRFGWMVSGVGDVNDDTYPDFVVGCPGFDGTIDNLGFASVYSGFDGSVLHQFVGEQEGLYFGESTAGPGDWNGDGVTDFALGAVDDTEGMTREGFLAVFEFETRESFVPGDRIEGSIDSAGDRQEVVFDGLKGMKLKLTVTELTGTLAPKLTLFDPAGEEVWTKKFKSSGSDQSASEKLSADGRYRLRIEGKNDSTGSFALLTDRKDSGEMSSVKEKAKPSGGEDHAVVTFRALDGATVDISVEPNDKFTEAPAVSLTDRNGNEIDVSGATTEDGNDVAVSGVSILKTNLFRVVVDDFPSAKKAKAKVKITITQPDPSGDTVVLP